MKVAPKGNETESHQSSVVCIGNKDELCCARAIVTAKAKEDNHPNWRGLTIQNEQAILFHIEANVPQGPSGYDELSKFALAPSLYDYQTTTCGRHARL